MGLVIAPFADRFVVRLPFMCSVRVHIEDETLCCEPYLGAVPRTRATLLRTLGLTALAFIALTTPAVQAPAPGIAVGLALLAVVSWGYDALRYILTESAIAQVRQAFIALVDNGTIGSTSPRLSATDVSRIAPGDGPPRAFGQREPERVRRED
jgi:hypothetical protein